MPSEFLNAQNVEVSCNMHINLFSKLAPFLLGFESIKARLLFVNKSFTQDKKRTLHNIKKAFTQYKKKPSRNIKKAFAQYKKSLRAI